MFLIAECGVNHDGKLDKALQLCDAAKHAGADMAKFQFFDSERLWGDARIKHLELRFADFEKLYAHCERIGIEFGCTAFGVAELTMLRPLLKRVKIPSGLNTNKALLEAANDTGLPVLFSTGMSEPKEILHSLSVFKPWETTNRVTVLQCTSSYPCRLEDVHLSVLKEYAEMGWPYGLSDHTTSISVPIAACALGATVIEKHFTLDTKAEGPDHKASITPNAFKIMRIALIEIEAAMGDSAKRVLPCEEALRKAWKK